MRSLAAVLFVALVACGQAAEAPTAQGEPAGAMRVENAWAAPTPGGVDVSAGYLTIVNDTGAADALIGVSAPRATRMEVHEMALQDGVMQMRAVERLELPAAEPVELAPSGRHLMFYGVTQPFSVGETIEVRLEFEHAEPMVVSLPVQRPGAEASHSGH